MQNPSPRPVTAQPGPAGSLAWPALLREISQGQSELVIETPEGGRVALIAESSLNDMRRRLGVSRVHEAAATLSTRELQVLEFAAGGMPGAVIAVELGIAVNTVAQHLVSVRRKLGVRTTHDAVAAARRGGILPRPV